MGKEKKQILTPYPKFRLKAHHIFDLDNLLKGIPDWLEKFGYVVYLKTDKQKTTDSGFLLERTWKAEKPVTDYVKYEIEVNLLLRDGQKVSVDKAGKQVEKWVGRLELDTEAKMVKDYKEFFKSKQGSFTHFLREIYEKFIRNEDLKRYNDQLLFSIMDFEKFLKSFFK